MWPKARRAILTRNAAQRIPQARQILICGAALAASVTLLPHSAAATERHHSLQTTKGSLVQAPRPRLRTVRFVKLRGNFEESHHKSTAPVPIQLLVLMTALLGIAWSCGAIAGQRHHKLCRIGS